MIGFFKKQLVKSNSQDSFISKALNFCADKEDTVEQDVREKVEFLKLRFHESHWSKGRLKALESISSQIIYGMLAGLTREDPLLVVEITISLRHQLAT